MLRIPHVCQAYTWTCGPACLAAVLYYWGAFDGSETELYEACGTTEQGTTPQGLVACAQEYGAGAVLRTDMLLSELRNAVACGITCILLVQAWAETPTDYRTSDVDGHYVVLCDITEHGLIVMDPSIPARYGTIPLDDFLRRWHDNDNGAQYVRAAILVNSEAPAEHWPLPVG